MGASLSGCGAGFAGLLACALLGSGQADAARPPVRGIIYNEDGNQRFQWDPPGAIKPERLDELVDALANSQVTVMSLCCCSQTTTFDTHAPGWEVFCRGFDPTKGNDQPFFGSLPMEDRETYRRFAQNQRLLLDAGICPMQRMIDRCRLKGISPWINLRMNDVHDAMLLDSPLHSSFWKAHHEYWRVPDERPSPHWNDRCLNYGLQPVRDRMMALIREVCDRFDVDGVELDWNRFPLSLRAGEELEQGRVLTEWMADVRAVVRAAETKRGHPILLVTRVPARPEVAVGTGLDAVTWARRGLIDHLIVAPFWATTDFDIPVERWAELLRDTGVGVTAGLDILVRPYPNAAATESTTEQSRGAALGALARGSQGLYLLNYVHTRRVPSLLKELGAMDTLAGKDRTYVVTYTDISIPGQPLPAALPRTLAPGEAAEFELFIGPRPAAGTRGEVRLTLTPQTAGAACVAAVLLNGSPPAAAAGRVFDGAALRAGYNTIRVANAGASGMAVEGVELALHPPGG
ncbi:MAG: hypothetical protein HYU66_05545 [Armatimonadetes bacterium]|nr:hypothetical protein [Armatimonadota bacterium]